MATESQAVNRWKKITDKKIRRDRARNELIKNINETERELRRFVLFAEKLERNIGDLNYGKRAALKADSWLQKARKMVAVDMLTSAGALSKSTIEMIIALPHSEME